MKAPVFTYGSLMFAPVWQRVVRGDYRAAPAVVDNHARYAVAGETYPGMVACLGETVRGLVYLDVSAEDLAALDRFEGEDYCRILVDAKLDSGQPMQAYAYVYVNSEQLTEQPWQPERFELERFVSTYLRHPNGVR